ncbi:hypothetical protein M404DRAFT_1000490, partial [Pisolithus tinctorius Marx 270]
DVVEYSQGIRGKEETHQLDHLILSYMPNHLKTLQTQKQEYLNNEHTEVDEQRFLRNESSNRSNMEMHKVQQEDVKGGPCHQSANNISSRILGSV